ncbi:hypothetical protein QN239_27475 [Mycolicibacterium sp. Y3]
MSRPNIVQVDRDAIEDRGLVDNDNTEEMRRASVAPEALQKNDHVQINEQEF